MQGVFGFLHRNAGGTVALIINTDKIPASDGDFFHYDAVFGISPNLSVGNIVHFMDFIRYMLKP